MKKTAIIVILALLGIAQTQAQVSLKPGLRGGLNFTHFSKGNNEYLNGVNNSNNRIFTSITDFYITLILLYPEEKRNSDKIFM